MVVLSTLVTLAGTLDSASAQAPENDLAFDPEVIRGILSNGLIYYVKKNLEPRNRAQFQLVVRAGSVFEEEHERGLAHFVEHMAFNGTERFSGNEIVEYLESVGSKFGADLNAYTSFDETVYKVEIPTDDPAVTETAFEILSDWAYAMTFDPDEVERERGVVVSELLNSLSASARLVEVAHSLLFEGSRYEDRFPIGVPEIIKTATPDDLREFYERWYRPDLMAVIAVGDFDAEFTVDKIRHHFAPPPEGEARQTRAARPETPTVRPEYPIPSHTDPRARVHSDPELPDTWVHIYTKLPAETGQSLAAYRLGLAESLFSRMAEARWMWSVRFEHWSSDTKVLFASIRLRPGADVPAWTTTMLVEMQRILRYGFTSSEMERGKYDAMRSIEEERWEGNQRTSQRLAEECIRHFLYDTPLPGIAEYELRRQLLPRVTLEEVNRLAEPWDEFENSVVFVTGHDLASDTGAEQEVLDKLRGAGDLDVEPKNEEHMKRVEEVWEGLFGRVEPSSLLELPEPGTIDAEHSLESIDAVRWTLSNGATVIAKQTDFHTNEVLFEATSPGGTSLVEDSDYIAAYVAAMAVMGSLSDKVNFPAADTAHVIPYIEGLFEGFYGEAASEYIEVLFQLVTLYATAASRLDPADLEAPIESLRRYLADSRSEPVETFAEEVERALSQDHFRSAPWPLGLLNAEISPERSAAVYADRFQDFSDFTFVIVGAFDWDKLRDLAVKYIATLPATGRREQWRDLGIDPPSGVVNRTVHTSVSKPRGLIKLVFAGGHGVESSGGAGAGRPE